MGRPSASFAAAEIGVLYLCKQCECLEEIDFAHGHPPGTSKIVLLLYIIYNFDQISNDKSFIENFQRKQIT